MDAVQGGVWGAEGKPVPLSSCGPRPLDVLFKAFTHAPIGMACFPSPQRGARERQHTLVDKNIESW